MAKMLQAIEKVCRGEIPPPPVARLIGFTLSAVEPGRAVVEFEAERSPAISTCLTLRGDEARGR